MLERIQSHSSSFTAAEQRVAHLLMKEPQAFSEWPVGAIAEKAKVSKPTVVRFCRRLGYEGLSDFKRKLVASLSEGVPFIHRMVNAHDNPADVLHKVVDNTVTALLKYRNDAPTASLEAAIAALSETHRHKGRLEFHGVGNSGIVAQDAQHKFFRLGFHTVAHSDGHLQIMSASLLGPHDTLVVFSNSGRPRDVLDGPGGVVHEVVVRGEVRIEHHPPLRKDELAQEPLLHEQVERVVDGRERHRHLGLGRLLVKHFGGQMAVALGEQDPAERHALPRRAQANVAQHRFDVVPGAAVERIAAEIGVIRGERARRERHGVRHHTAVRGGLRASSQRAVRNVDAREHRRARARRGVRHIRGDGRRHVRG